MAFNLLLQAAGHSLPEAQFNLGLMYAAGNGVAKNKDAAFDWYQKSIFMHDYEFDVSAAIRLPKP